MLKMLQYSLIVVISVLVTGCAANFTQYLFLDHKMEVDSFSKNSNLKEITKDNSLVGFQLFL